jgi:hypothetical protein
MKGSTIENGVAIYDYGKTENYIYAGGKGQDAARKIVQSYDTEDYLRSIWARSEGFADLPSVGGDSLQNAADAELYARRRKVEIKGDLVDTPQLRYGRDFDFGDIVTARLFGDIYDAHISSVTVGMREGREIVDIGADYRL